VISIVKYFNSKQKYENIELAQGFVAQINGKIKFIIVKGNLRCFLNYFIFSRS